MNTPRTEYDYELQAWLEDGIVAPCGHPPERPTFGPCCAAGLCVGMKQAEARAYMAQRQRKGTRS